MEDEQDPLRATPDIKSEAKKPVHIEGMGDFETAEVAIEKLDKRVRDTQADHTRMSQELTNAQKELEDLRAYKEAVDNKPQDPSNFYNEWDTNPEQAINKRVEQALSKAKEELRREARESRAPVEQALMQEQKKVLRDSNPDFDKEEEIKVDKVYHTYNPPAMRNLARMIGYEVDNLSDYELAFNLNRVFAGKLGVSKSIPKTEHPKRTSTPVTPDGRIREEFTADEAAEIDRICKETGVSKQDYLKARDRVTEASRGESGIIGAPRIESYEGRK